MYYVYSHLDCMIFEERMIKSWLVVDMYAVDYISIRALFWTFSHTQRHQSEFSVLS